MGVTVLDNIMYVVCEKSSVISMYSIDTLSPLGKDIHVEGMNDPMDIVVCLDDRQLYAADWGDQPVDHCIWRVSADNHSYVKWLPTESTTDAFRVRTLSVTSRRLLVTSYPRSLRQYSTTDRQLLRVVQMPVDRLYHGVETTHDTFVISHRDTAQDKEQYAVSELFIYCFSLSLKYANSLSAFV